MTEIFIGLGEKTFAITGASGYIGTSLINTLSTYTKNILAIGRSEISYACDVKSIQADIRNPDIWEEIVNYADVIYHLGGNTSLSVANLEPSESISSTLLPVTHLIAAAIKLNKKPRVIFASTATVYGLTPSIPVNEELSLNPITVYDLHKTFAEKQLAMATEEGLIYSASLRLSNVYGPSFSKSMQQDRGVLNKMMEMAMAGNEISVYGNGNYLRDYIYIDDVIKAFLLTGLKDDIVTGPYNVASGKSISILEAFQLLISQAKVITGKEINFKFVPWQAGVNPIEKRNFIADINKINKSLGWSPKIMPEQGIAKMLEVINRRVI